MAKAKVRMAINPFVAVERALAKAEGKIVAKRISFIDYDEEADVLYVKFKHSKVVDHESLDENGMILASLNEDGEVIGLIIMEASSLVK
ncbi:MAG: hypothetical protein AOA65_2042 [Candidatus Bathyarchaeota archaeon BA1]|nr:MAG: hypothetical protein AOA65_2042 [Candidatus Bathyarchaeota archaeon BA1]